MKRIHQIPTIDLHRFPDLESYAIAPTLMKTHGDSTFARFVEDTLQGCENVYLLVPPSYQPTELELEYSSHIWVYGRPIPFDGTQWAHIHYEKYTQSIIANVMIGSYEEVVKDYEWLCSVPGVAIGFPRQKTDAWGNISSASDGFNRFSYIYRMVKEKKLKHKVHHYLFGLDNPAELVAYSKAFTSSVRTSFFGVTSVRCYIDSKFGVEYQPRYGLLTNPIRDDNLDEGMRTSLQTSLFRLNDGWLKEFIEGHGGEDIWQSYGFQVEEVGHGHF